LSHQTAGYTPFVAELEVVGCQAARTGPVALAVIDTGPESAASVAVAGFVRAAVASETVAAGKSFAQAADWLALASAGDEIEE